MRPLKDIHQFKASLRGELIDRDDSRYDETRSLYNAMIDKRPLLIARCVDAPDVLSEHHPRVRNMPI